MKRFCVRNAWYVALAMVSFSAGSASASCRASIIGNLSLHDKTAGMTLADPVPLPLADAVDGIQDGSVPPPIGGYAINGEGVAERMADLLIYDATGVTGPGFCFNSGNVITVRFNGLLALSGQRSLLSMTYFDVYDSNGGAGLSIGSADVNTAFSANQPMSYVTIRIAAAGTSAPVAGPSTVLYGNASGATGAALRIKNLRIDATSVSGDSATAVSAWMAQNGSTVPIVLGVAGPAQSVVATKMLTVSNIQLPKTPAANDIGSGIQGSGQGLRGGAQGLSFVPGFAKAFRVAGTSCQPGAGGAGTCVSQVANDIATAATSLVFAVTSIPSGVTVMFPPKIDTTVANGTAGGMVWTARAGGKLTNAAAPGSLVVVYDTTFVGSSPGTQQIETADFADSGTDMNSASNPNCGSTNSGSNCDSFPKIGVMIGRPSAAGTAQISIAFGPGDVSMFAGDDLASGMAPRYVGGSSPTGGTWPTGGNSNVVFTRYLVSPRDFFTVTATRTTLLFPYVSTAGGYNSGISIVNTCQDTLGTTSNSVYGTFGNSTCNQIGPVTFYFFGIDPSPGANETPVQVSLNTDVTVGGISVASACRGFDNTGRIAPGRSAACSLSSLLPMLPGSPRGFEGYVIAVAGFNNAHGITAHFNASGAPFASFPALVMDNVARPNSQETLGQ